MRGTASLSKPVALAALSAAPPVRHFFAATSGAAGIQGRAEREKPRGYRGFLCSKFITSLADRDISKVMTEDRF